MAIDQMSFFFGLLIGVLIVSVVRFTYARVKRTLRDEMMERARQHANATE